MSAILQGAIEECKRIFERKEESDYNEAKVTDKFVRPLFESVLGWKFGSDEVRPQKQTPSGPVDYSFEIEGSTKFLLEIKRLDESLDGHRTIRGRKQTYPEQAINYAWQLQVDWVVLSNFAETRLYWSHVKRPLKGLVWHIPFHELHSKFESLNALSREKVLTGSLKKLEKGKDRKDITIEFLEDLLDIRRSLTDNLHKNNPTFDQDSLRESVQKIIDRLMVTRVAEDREIIGFETLFKQLESWKQRGLPSPFMRDLKLVFRAFDDVYDTKLFATDPCEDLKIENPILTGIIEGLNKYNFNALSADVLGAIYENYIGNVLVQAGKKISIEQSYQTRKHLGIYYTPTSIVEYLVRKSVLPLLKEAKTRDQVRRLKILDPACGSGSFLIKAYDLIKEWYDNYYRSIGGKDTSNLLGYEVDVGKQLLSENLFGVDLDEQAGEIAAMNLMLKALRKGEKLPPILGQTIKGGNSLLFGDDRQVEELLGPQFKDLRPFNWNSEFKDVMDSGGFAVVIGNPPWGAETKDYSTFLEKHFDLAKGQYDTYELFIELSKRILMKGGIWGFVIPDSIFLPEHVKLREFLSTETTIDRIVKLGEGFFEGVYRGSVILVFRKEHPPNDHKVRVFTLMKQDRERILASDKDINLDLIEREKSFLIPQSRFSKDPDYSFDIYSTEEDRQIMRRMESNAIQWELMLDSSRGVEFSETGLVIRCPNCLKWDNPPAKRKGAYDKKKCTHCGFEYDFDHAAGVEKIVVDTPSTHGHSRPFLRGDAVNRYYSESPKYIDITKTGVNYKDEGLYHGPKLLVRKTGVGIYATIDHSNAYVPQVVFIFKTRQSLPEDLSQLRLEYVLGVLNSRLMLYYNYKKFGEVEWKSFPYVTPKILRQLPIRKIDFQNTEQEQLHEQICSKVNEALDQGKNLRRETDFEIEELVMRLYQIAPEDRLRIFDELKKVQDLRIIREVMGPFEPKPTKIQKQSEPVWDVRRKSEPIWDEAP